MRKCENGYDSNEEYQTHDNATVKAKCVAILINLCRKGGKCGFIIGIWTSVAWPRRHTRRHNDASVAVMQTYGKTGLDEAGGI